MKTTQENSIIAILICLSILQISGLCSINALELHQVDNDPEYLLLNQQEDEHYFDLIDHNNHNLYPQSQTLLQINQQLKEIEISNEIQVQDAQYLDQIQEVELAEDDINVDDVDMGEESEDESEFLMLDSDAYEAEDLKDHSSEFYAAGYTGPTLSGQEYVRVIPEQFDDESPNKFMKNIIENYALEQKTSDGQPSGNFKMNRQTTESAARQLLQKYKHLDLKGENEYMNQYFQRTWEHFDVNNEGTLDVLDMTAFMKFFLSDQSIDLDA